ncbi:50S ribosomal protein L29, partial [Microgenomates bacterium UTCPR1]
GLSRDDSMKVLKTAASKLSVKTKVVSKATMKKIIKEIRSKSIAELEKQRVSLAEEIAKLKLSKKAIPQKDSNLLKKKRKQMAILLTIMTEKKELEDIKK